MRQDRESMYVVMRERECCALDKGCMQDRLAKRVLWVKQKREKECSYHEKEREREVGERIRKRERERCINSKAKEISKRKWVCYMLHRWVKKRREDYVQTMRDKEIDWDNVSKKKPCHTLYIKSVIKMVQRSAHFCCDSLWNHYIWGLLQKVTEETRY